MSEVNTKDFILASGSPQRIKLLEEIGFKPKEILPADIDETEKKNEKPLNYVKRVTREKAFAVSKQRPGEVILSGDTTVLVANKVLHKANNDEEQVEVMRLLSGRPHKVITSICVISKEGRVSQKTVTTRVYMKRLTEEEIREYVATKEWVGCVGYKIEGCLSAFIIKIIGSYSSVVGLPQYEARNLLIGVGVK